MIGFCINNFIASDEVFHLYTFNKCLIFIQFKTLIS